MSLDEIAVILAALHDTTPEVARGIIQGAEKLRGIVLRAAPAPEPEVREPPEAAPEPAPPDMEAHYDTARRCVDNFLRKNGTTKLTEISARTGLYLTVAEVCGKERDKGRYVKAGINLYRLAVPDAPVEPLSTPVPHWTPSVRRGIQSTVEQCIVSASGPVGAKEVSEKTGLNYDKVRKAMEHLYLNDRISRAKKGYYTAPVKSP